MKKATYKEISDLIRNRQSFVGNCCRANRFGDNYEIYSYNTLIYQATLTDIYFDSRYYSATTSRLQNIIRQELLKNLKDKT